MGNEHSSSFRVWGFPSNISFWGFVHSNQQLCLGFWCNISFPVLALLAVSKEHLIIVQGLGFPSQHLLIGFCVYQATASFRVLVLATSPFRFSVFLRWAGNTSSSFRVWGFPASISFSGFVLINQQLRLGFWRWQHLLSGSCFSCGGQGTPHHRSRLAVSQPTSPFGVLCIAANSCNISFSVFAFLASSKEHLIIVQGLGFPC